MVHILVERDGRSLVEFRDWVDATGNGFALDPQGWSGWPAPSVKRESVERQSAHGSYHLPTFYGDTTVQVSGHALAKSAGELAQMRRDLMRCYPDSVTVTVEDASGVLWADASLASAPIFETLPGSDTEAAFTVEFWFPDPWRYGPTTTVPITNGVSVVNRGDETAWPLIKFVGPAAAGAFVSANGRTKKLVESIPAGGFVEVDTRRDIATSHVGWRVPTVGLSPYLRPGVNVVTMSGASGSVSVTETYI